MGIIVESNLGSSDIHTNGVSAYNGGLTHGDSFSAITPISITAPAGFSSFDDTDALSRSALTSVSPITAMSMLDLSDLGYKDPLAMGDLVSIALGTDNTTALDYTTLSTLATQPINFESLDSISAFDSSLYTQPLFQIDLPPPMSSEEWDAYMEREYGDDDPSFFEWVGGGIDVAYTAVGDATVWTVQKTLGDGAVSAMAADDTYFSFAADAGDVYWEEGAGKYAEIYLWQGLVKNGVGYTVEGFVNLPTLVPELAAAGLNICDGGQRNWQLYSHDVGREFADAVWYNKSGIGGRYVPENEKQAALLGFGSVMGDAASIPVGGLFGKLNIFSRSRHAAPLSRAWTAVDIAQTSVMSPFTMSNIMDEHQEAELMAKIPGIHPEQVYDYLLKNRFSDVQIPEGANWEDKHNLYVGAMTQYLIEAGEQNIESMDWQQREHIYRQYDDILNDIGGALAPQTKGPISHLDPSPIQTDVKMRSAFGAAHDHVIADAAAETPAPDSVIAYIGPISNMKAPAA
jgi:hypothetical protein